MVLKMVVRKTKEDRSVRQTQPVVLPVKQEESLSYMNSREFTYIFLNLQYVSCKKKCSERNRKLFLRGRMHRTKRDLVTSCLAQIDQDLSNLP